MTEDAVALMARETALIEGDVPASLADALKHSPVYSLSRDAFLLNLPSGLKFHYRQGRGVAFARPATVSDSEVDLFFNGSVYGAIAWINGLVPLHASAIGHDGTVHGFTGQSGAGKSTLVAALGSCGFEHFCDDVLVLDMRDAAEIICLPGHKHMKLWRDALALTGLAAGAQVRGDLDKYFVAPTGGIADSPLPLGNLYFLEERSRDAPILTALSGAERLSYARTAFYRPHFGAALTEHRNLFAILARLGGRITMTRFDRPRRRDVFAAGVDFIALAIRTGS